MKTRDLTQAQFDKRCKEYGFKPIGFLGYYDISNGINISILNAGTNRRNQLAYLMRQKDKHERQPK